MAIISITAKCSDAFSAQLRDNDKTFLGEYEGYVPRWLPNSRADHDEDYVTLDIDTATGKILNWRTPTKAQLKETFGIK